MAKLEFTVQAESLEELMVFADSRRFAEEWTYRFLSSALADTLGPSPQQLRRIHVDQHRPSVPGQPVPGLWTPAGCRVFRHGRSRPHRPYQARS